MAKKSRPTFKKFQKEKARTQKQQSKEARKLETRELKANNTRVFGDEDPDIAGILPGPQPLPEQWTYDQPNLAAGEEEA
jgi:hypothetical protein